MDTIKAIKKKEISVEVLHRNGKVTIASSNGFIIEVISNDLGATLGAVFAANLLYEHDRQWKWEDKFDVKMEVITYKDNG